MVPPKANSVKTPIDAFETTSDKLTGRAGLTLVSRYLEASGVTALLAQRFAFLRKSRKGLALKSSLPSDSLLLHRWYRSAPEAL